MAKRKRSGERRPRKKKYEVTLLKVEGVKNQVKIAAKPEGNIK